MLMKSGSSPAQLIYGPNGFRVMRTGDHVVCAVSALGADRILFAVDYPWVSPKEGVELVERTPLSDTDKEKIYHLNAEKLLGL